MKKTSVQPASSPSDIRLRHELLRNEYQALKRKLESKNDALQILNQTLSECQRERDEYKLMADKLRNRCQTMKKQLQIDQKISSTVFPTCDSMVVSSQHEVEDLKQKLADAEGDIKLLREKIIKHRLGTAEQQKTSRKSLTADERDSLLDELEKSKDSYSQLEQDMKQLLDMKEELETERDTYKSKYNRLNKEVNFIMRGDEKHVVDIDALIMENKFLQQRVKQLQEENAAASASLKKYRHLVEKRKPGAGILKSTTNHVIGGLLISQRQIKQLLASSETTENGPSLQVVSDLKGLAASLLETINDKNLALNHQRKSNKLLGTRITELENKLHQLELFTVESSNLRDKFQSLCELRGDCATIRSLIPQVSLDSSEIEHTDDSSSRHSQETENSDNSTAKSDDVFKSAGEREYNEGEASGATHSPDYGLERSLLDFSTPLKLINDEYNQLGDILNSDNEGDEYVTAHSQDSSNLCESVHLRARQKYANNKVTTKSVCFVSPLQKMETSSIPCNNPDMLSGATNIINSSQTENSKLSASRHASYSSMQSTSGGNSLQAVSSPLLTCNDDPKPPSAENSDSEAELLVEPLTDTSSVDRPSSDTYSSMLQMNDKVTNTSASQADAYQRKLLEENTQDFWNAAIQRKMSAFSKEQLDPSSEQDEITDDPEPAPLIDPSTSTNFNGDSTAYSHLESTVGIEHEGIEDTVKACIDETIPKTEPASQTDVPTSSSHLESLDTTDELPKVSPDWRSANDFELPPIQTITDDIPHLDIDISLANLNNSNNSSSPAENMQQSHTSSNGSSEILENPNVDQNEESDQCKLIIRTDLLD